MFHFSALAGLDDRPKCRGKIAVGVCGRFVGGRPRMQAEEIGADVRAAEPGGQHRTIRFDLGDWVSSVGETWP